MIVGLVMDGTGQPLCGTAEALEGMKAATRRVGECDVGHIELMGRPGGFALPC